MTVTTGAGELEKKSAKYCKYAFSSDFDSHRLKHQEFHPELSMQFNRSQTTQLKHWTSKVK